MSNSKINDDFSDVASSCVSEMSGFSVSHNGNDDMPLEDAIDHIFSNIQEHINQIHVELRNLCMSADRNEDYGECLEYHEALKEHVIEGCNMFKSVVKVSKQLLPTKPKAWIDPRKALGASEVDNSFSTDN